MLRLTPALPISALLLLVSAPQVALQAQRGELRGRVVEALDTTRAVVAAEVELVGTGLRGRTDNSGVFYFRDVATRAYDLQVRRIGYKSVVRHIAIDSGSAPIMHVRMERAAAELTEVVIKGRSVQVPPRMGQVYARAARGWGKLFTRADIVQQNPADLKSLLATLPAVQVNDRGITFQRCQAGLEALNVALSQGQQAGRSVEPKRHPGHVQVYVDGMRMTWTTTDQTAEADADRVLSRIHPSSVEAMEVYTGVSRLPPEFHSDACAAIVIWTKSY